MIHYRIVGYNSGGTNYGSDRTFQLTPSQAAPTVQTLAASSVTSSSAQLNGTVNPNGATTTAYFQYGLTTSYGGTTGSGNYGSGTTAQNVALPSGTLGPPGTVIHYRIVGYNSGGTNYGSDLTFQLTPSQGTPTITSISPNSGSTAGGNSVTIDGANLQFATSVTFGGTAATIAYSATTGKLQPIAPAHAAGAVNVTVTTPGGTVTSPNGYTYTVSTGTGTPIVQTLAASAVTTTTAQLNGHVNPNGYSTTAYFEYGLTATYGSATSSGNFGTAARDISFAVMGLSPNTTYHYRIVAVNNSGTSRGTDATLTTLPTSTTSQQAWVSGTSGLGLRLRNGAALSASVLLVIPEGSSVTLLGDTQNADGYLWRRVRYLTLDGWAAGQFLVFAPPGQTPTPPQHPTGLRQLLANGVTAISVGGSVNSGPVVLAATVGGASEQQFNVQFEVRPSGNSFSGPTHESGLVRGGSEGRVTVSSMANQGYRWRARVLDGSGVPSGWVEFNATVPNFVVNVPRLPSALFTWTPSTVFTDQSVQFSASAAGGAGLTFNWDFGGGQTASGATVNRTFSQIGEITVTLTVADAQANQVEHTETIIVINKLLQERINQLAQQTSMQLDDILAAARQTAIAANYFQTGVDEAEGKIALSTAVAGTAAMLKLGVVTEEIVSAISEPLLKKVFKDHQTYTAIYIPNLEAFIAQKKSELEQLRQLAIAASSQLTPQQAEQLALNLRARYLGNLSLKDSYVNKSHLVVTFADLKEFDESHWTFVWGERVFNVSVGIGVVAVTASTGGAAAVILEVSAGTATFTQDLLKILSSQSADAQMLGLGVAVLEQGRSYAGQMIDNCTHGLEAVRDAQVPATPSGEISIEHVAEGFLDQFAFARRWFTRSAYANVTIRNTGQTVADYRVEAVYRNRFTTVQLFDLPFLAGIGERNYDIQVMSFRDGIRLNPGEQRIVTLHYLSPQGGQLPRGRINYTLTAQTPDGSYWMDSETGEFGTTFIDGNGQTVDHSQLQDVLLETAPVNSSLLQFSGSGVCNLNIYVRNPLEYPLLANLRQPFPSGTTVVEAGGGTVNSSELLWELDLLAGESRFVQATLKLPTPLGTPPLSNTVLMVYDGPNTNWLQFEAAPTLIQSAESPAPVLQAIGATANGFEIALQAFVPGVYQVEATKDFSTWESVLTQTNSQRVINIQDSGSLTNSARFYRAFRLP